MDYWDLVVVVGTEAESWGRGQVDVVVFSCPMAV